MDHGWLMWGHYLGGTCCKGLRNVDTPELLMIKFLCFNPDKNEPMMPRHHLVIQLACVSRNPICTLQERWFCTFSWAIAIKNVSCLCSHHRAAIAAKPTEQRFLGSSEKRELGTVPQLRLVRSGTHCIPLGILALSHSSSGE